MVYRDVASSSVRWLLLVGLLSAWSACSRERSTPVPERSKAPVDVPAAPAPIVAAAGGATAVALNLAGSPGTAPISAASLTNIKEFSAASDKPTMVPYFGKLYDDQKSFDESTHQFKAGKAGAYQVCASLASFSKDFDLFVYANGTRDAILAHSRQGAGSGCRTVSTKAGDSLEVWVQQNTGAPMTFAANDFWNWLTIHSVQKVAAADNINAFEAPPAVFTKAAYSSERYDVDKQLDVPAKGFVANAAGTYRFCTALRANEGDFELDLFVDDNRENAFSISNGGFANGCRSLRLAKGQRVDVRVYPTGNAAIAFTPRKGGNWLTIDQVPAAEASLSVSLDTTIALTAAPKSLTKVVYTSPLYDEHQLYVAQAGHYRTPVPRDYLVCASLASLTQDFELDIAVNSVRDKAIAVSRFGIGQGCRVVRLKNAGDALEVWTHQGSPTALTFAPNIWWSWLTIDRI